MADDSWAFVLKILIREFKRLQAIGDMDSELTSSNPAEPSCQTDRRRRPTRHPGDGDFWEEIQHRGVPSDAIEGVYG